MSEDVTKTFTPVEDNGAEKWKKSIQYVQFSKRVIQWVSIGFGILSLVGMCLCYISAYPAGIVSIVQTDAWYAVQAFIAYSGNSALEKWLIKKGGGTLGSELQTAVNAVVSTTTTAVSASTSSSAATKKTTTTSSTSAGNG